MEAKNRAVKKAIEKLEEVVEEEYEKKYVLATVLMQIVAPRRGESIDEYIERAKKEIIRTAQEVGRAVAAAG